MSDDRIDQKLRGLLHQVRADDVERAPAFAEIWGRALEAHEGRGVRARTARWWSGTPALATALTAVAVVAIALVVWRAERDGTGSDGLLDDDGLAGWTSPSDSLLGVGETVSLDPAAAGSLDGSDDLALDLPTSGLIDEAFATLDVELEL